MSQYVQLMIPGDQDELPQTNFVAQPMATGEDMDDTSRLFSLRGMVLGLVVAHVDWAIVRKKKTPKGFFKKYDSRYNALWLATMVGYGMVGGKK